MKKSSIFVIVYVMFLFFSTYIPNDEYLTKIALGASLAGMFFAWSDMFLNTVQHFVPRLDNIKKIQCDLKTELLNYTDEEKSKGEIYDTLMQKYMTEKYYLIKNIKK